ncbi:MAG: hypothetical protein ACRD3A_15265 [Terriglobales bacterium]
MKPTSRIGIGLLSLAGLLAATASAQSLGEYARQQRAQKPATPPSVKVYTNDNLSGSGALSEAGAPASSSSPASAKAAAAAEKDEQKKAEDRSKLEAGWRAKFAEQKNRIALLERELKLPRVENNMQLTALYSGVYDARLHQNAAARVDEDDRKYKDELKEKQKALEEAKQKLEDMKDELRRGGLPVSWAD